MTDLKPSNLFLRNRQVEGLALLDFGIARPIAARAMTKTGFIVGTVDYMAPEQARGERRLGPSVDLFALGCVLFECLIGKPPFGGKHVAAVLTKVLFEEAPRLRSLRAELPEALEALLAQLLAKEPGRRPADAAALLAELEALSIELDAAAPAPGTLSGPESLGGSEQQLVSFLVASLPQEELLRAQTLSAGSDSQESDAFRDGTLSLLSRYGLRGAWLVSGTLVATLSLPGSATDQAVQAARAALALKAHWPEASVALTIGHGLLREPLTIPVGDALDQAGQLLARAAQTPEAREAVLIDKVTAQLLDARFTVEPASSAVFLLQSEHSTADETRLLLGQPTPCLGRERELALLESAFAQCAEEAEAHAVLLIAPPGTGKSRLRHEFVRRLQARGEALELLVGRGDPMSAGSSYGLLGQALRRLCGVLDGEELAVRRAKLQGRLGLYLAAAEASRVVEFLGELTGVPFPDAERVQLRAARQEPHLMADGVLIESEFHPIVPRHGQSSAKLGSWARTG